MPGRVAVKIRGWCGRSAEASRLSVAWERSSRQVKAGARIAARVRICSRPDGEHASGVE